MKTKDYLWFIAPWNFLFGFIVAFALILITELIDRDLYSIYYSLDLIEILKNKFWIMFFYGLSFWSLCLIFHLIQYRFFGKSKFAPDNNYTKDKLKAMYPVVPKRYLSKTPNDFTIGKYRNRYFRIPIDSNDIKHTLIIGSPGSFKSSTLLNSLIWNFNFEKDKAHPVIYCIDCKPELSRKSIDESRNDVRIINPSTHSSCGFDVWYGLDQDVTDDQLIERADLIARTLISNPSGNSDNEFFYISAQNLMVPFLVYGYRKNLEFVETILQIIRIPLQDLITTVLMDDDMQANHPKVIGCRIKNGLVK